MKASSKKVLAALTVIVLAVMIFAGCTPKPPKLGTIDMYRIIQESPKAQAYQKQLDERGADIQKKYKEISDDPKLSAEERQKQQDAAREEFIAAKTELEDQLNAEIETAVKAVAKEKKMDIVFFKQSVSVGGEEITQEVIDRLK